MKCNTEKQLINDLKIINHFIKLTTGISKLYIPILIISSVFKAVSPLINIIMPKFIIDELLGATRINVLLILVLITVLLNAFVNLINDYFQCKINKMKIKIVDGFDLITGKKVMEMPFENLEDPQILNLKEQAIYPIKNQGVIDNMILVMTSVLTDIITIIGVVAIIVTLDFYIIIFILCIVAINSLIYKKTQQTQYKVFQELIPTNRAFFYYLSLTNDFSIAKDIRLYNMSPLILSKIKEYNKVTTSKFGRLFRRTSRYSGISNINLQFQLFIIYGYMAYKVLTNNINLGSFIMYVSAASNFSSSVSKLLSEFITLRQLCRYLNPFMELENIKSLKTNGIERVEDIEKFCFEFKNVSFKYPRSNEYILKDISIKINEGEKISIVGLNGAGKTTFIKLLTRLFEPTEGEILLNGVNIKEYDYNEYMRIFGVVFQDFKLFSFSVKDNIILSDNIVEDKILNAIKKCGLEEVLSNLGRGLDTVIYKNFEKDGIEFSGGQAQKLAIARTIYKDAPVVILDEPTAALDPIAEFEIYSKFNELVGNKTAIYISHRLSSCRFCDKVFVFSKGRIVEEGSHNHLIVNAEGEYNKMYMTQAQYYV